MKEKRMKHIATVALILNLGVAGVYAQQSSVKMPFSGTSASSTVNLQQPGRVPAKIISPVTVHWDNSPFVI
jgi:hypothetical protein